MAMFGNPFRLIASITACALGAVTMNAAEIRTDPFYGKAEGAVLEGIIEAGDFDKLRSFILDGGGANEIYLASPGGDLAEAIKIGRLVRALKLATVVPASSDFREKLGARHGLKNPKAN